MRIWLQNFVSIQPRTSLEKNDLSWPPVSWPPEARAGELRAKSMYFDGQQFSAILGREADPWLRVVGHDISLFSRLVLGCIETKFCNQIRIFSGFSRSTKLSSWFFEKVAKFCKKSQNLQKIYEISGFLQKNCWFLRKSLIFCKILQIFWQIEFSQIVL